jgi:hypothetical protein
MISNLTGGDMSNNKKNRIRQDIKGSWYCVECGKAGFSSKQSGFAHLTSCRGIDTVKDMLKGHHQATTTTTTMAPLTRVNDVLRVAGSMLAADPSVAIAGGGGAGEEELALLRIQNAELLGRLENVEKLAGNHIGHLTGVANNVQSFFESPIFKWVLVIAGIAAIAFLLERGDDKTKQAVGSKILDLAIKKI